MVACELWERALIPSLLSGAGTWLGECKDAITLCDQLQNFFWRIMLKVPESCPKVALRSETGMIGMKWRVWEAKIFLLMRIRNHNEDALCKQIYEQGKSKGWPGLSKEVSKICEIINIPDVNETVLPKPVIKRAVFKHHYDEMKEEVNKMRKLEKIKDEDFKQVQDYFNNKSIENARMAFKVRCQMLESIPGNFKNKYKKEEDKLKCRDCNMDAIMTQSHCVECTGWVDIKKDLDLTKIDDMVQFFRRLLSERAKKDEEGLKVGPHCTTPATGGDSSDC